MKSKKYLSRDDLNFYRELLFNLKEDILQQIRDISKDTLMKSQKDISGNVSGYSLHMADVASDNYEREFSLGRVSGERSIILEIDEALKRIEDKNYGLCEKCEKHIAKIRLKAIPYAKFCKKCQEEKEKTS